MGDMGDIFRAMKDTDKERKKRNLENANPKGWTEHTEYHWSRTLQGKRLDYWPSRNKFQHNNKIMVGDVEGYIRKRTKQMKEIELIRTCHACPEQYDAFVDGEQVGYLRLRHGEFTVEYPDVNGKLIYEAQPEGDGMFSGNEREYFLNKAKEEINKQLKEGE